KTLYLGLGGSATNDGGTGIADALGYVFKDENDNPLRPMGVNLSKIHQILMPKDGLLDTIKVIAINDVGNPLHGKQGAAYVYGAQKGANKEQIVLLDTGLRHLAERVRTSFEKSFERLPGSGAAGGTAYGLKVFLNAEYTRGIDFVLGIAGVETLMKSHVIDYIFTGEGKIDQQTVYGKLIKGVADLGSEHDIPVIAVCGKLDMETKGLDVLGLTQVLEIMDTSKPVQYSMDNAAEMVEQKVRQYLIDAVQDNY
ncbi:MAG: glycerate kinase, partial [Bacteroidota bacterium]